MANEVASIDELVAEEHETKIEDEEVKSLPEAHPNQNEEDIDERALYILDNLEDALSDANAAIKLLMEKEMQQEAEGVQSVLDICYALQAEVLRVKKHNNELLPKIDDANDKLVQSLQITASSQETINKLKAALEDSWREVDASRVREQDYQDEIRELYEKCNKFEQKGKQQEEDSSDLGPLTKYKQIILRERDRLNAEVLELERRLQMQRFYGETLEQMCQNVEEANSKLRNTVDRMESEENKAERKIQMMSSNLEELKDVNNSLLKRTDAYEKQVEEQQALIKEKVKELEKMRLSMDRIKMEYSNASKKFIALKKSYNGCIQDKKVMAEQIKDMSNEITAKENDLMMKTKQYRKLTSDYDILNSRNKKLEKVNVQLQEEVTKFKNMLNTRESDVLAQQKNMEDLRRIKDIVTHERDTLRTEVTKLNNQINELRHINMMRNNTIDSLYLDIAKHQKKVEEIKKIISKVEKERDEQIQEVELLHDKIDYLTEQIQLKADHATELQRQLSEKHASYIKVQQLLETTNSERLMLQRSLQCCSEERNSLKNLQSVTNHQMTQLTEEITLNQNKINVLNLHIEKVTREKQEVVTELRGVKKLLSSTRAELKEVKSKNEKLQKTLAEDELRFMKLAHSLEETRKEKNLIGLQMVRRNDEISLLKERLEIIQTAIDRGQVQYNQRIEDIRLLKLEMSKLQTQRDILKRGLSNTANMRREIIRLQRCLDQERIECRALKEDLRVPVNVHRWRVLKGSDPDRFMLSEKVRILQKRLLLRFVEGTQREQALQNCHKLYISLKCLMEKLPSYQVKEDFIKSQRVLRIREKKLKALTAELNVKDIEVKTRDCTIAELTTNLVTVKKDLINERKLVSKLLAKKPIPLPPGKVCTA